MRRLTHYLSLIFLAGTLTACTAPPPLNSATPAETGVEAAQETAKAAAPAPSGSSAADSTVTSGRAGLATAWGEDQRAPTHSVSFTAADPDRPSLSAQIYYNDTMGTQAMANQQAALSRQWFNLANNLIAVALLDNQQQPWPGVNQAGRLLVNGTAGENYIIAVRNHSQARLKALLSVDGLDVLDGQPAAYHKGGYIISPGNTLMVRGFRRSQETVAAFRFSGVDESYVAKRYGDTRQVGVIGIALFHEAGSVFGPDAAEIERRRRADPFPGNFASPPPP